MDNTSSTKTAPVSSPTIPLTLVGDLTTVSTRTLRRRSMSNLLRMGHCAPTVMQTLLDASDIEAEWLVKLTAGLPGGIGNTGAECGGVTAPLVLIGLRHARDAVRDGLPPAIDKGHDLLQRFARCHGTTLCREIRGTDSLPLQMRRSGSSSTRALLADAVEGLCACDSLCEPRRVPSAVRPLRREPVPLRPCGDAAGAPGESR